MCRKMHTHIAVNVKHVCIEMRTYYIFVLTFHLGFYTKPSNPVVCERTQYSN